MNSQLIAAIAAALSIATFAAPASAKSERVVEYSAKVVWPTAVRHIRVDEGHKIIDKDAEVGYVVFEVEDSGKKYRGALELIEIPGKKADDGSETAPKVKLVLRIDERPTYMETAILDRLEQKLRTERR